MPSMNLPLTDEEALAFHKLPRPGKLSVTPTKPMATQRDLALAYSPGVAVPVKEIARDPEAARQHTLAILEIVENDIVRMSDEEQQ